MFKYVQIDTELWRTIPIRNRWFWDTSLLPGVGWLLWHLHPFSSYWSTYGLYHRYHIL